LGGRSAMIKHRIDGKSLADWEKFHDFFASTFDFPAYYGRNMDAWNDCMSDYCYSKGLVSLHIDNAAEFKTMNPTAFAAIVECSAFINWRSTDKGGDPLIVLSFYV
jgi:RNAse (barnase) inhibitor barstar